MKYLVIALLSISTLAPGQENETEVEWKVLAKASDINTGDTAAHFLKKIDPTVYKDAKEKAELERLKKLASSEPSKLTPKDLLKLKKVRSIQIAQYGVFSYPYFNCRFKNSDQGMFFEKTTGSQRKSGLVFVNDPHTLVFLGASTVNNEPQRKYSGLTRSKNTQHDAVGVIIKRGKTYLAIFPKNNRWEIYEFK